ncbi:hypothetical protein ACH5RR_039485 [Cinchona calisaya]|uniref:Reverse transcriptase zinc-binding domain-containing protein n=1 Tax=Cinchona calisaya TaxID=153742 RepID=A0ABD2Y1S9_9GENT
MFYANMVYPFGSCKTAKGCSIIEDGKWKWPTRKRTCVETKRLIQATPLSFVPCANGKDQWHQKGSTLGQFTVSSAVQAVRGASTTVEWLKIVWHKRHVLRVAFVMWLLCKRRFMTKERMKAWEIQVDIICILCRQQEESMEHLFFE